MSRTKFIEFGSCEITAFDLGLKGAKGGCSHKLGKYLLHILLYKFSFIYYFIIRYKVVHPIDSVIINLSHITIGRAV